MTQPNPSTAMARAIIDELARGGVTLVVISPGSRSAALALAAEEHPAIDTVVALDERSGGFHALGRAKSDGLPAATICTSGTAAANYYPAVIEAEMSLTPLVILSADRAAELQGIGANQTISQTDLYGGHVRLFSHIEAPTGSEDENDSWRTEVSSALGAATGVSGRPGPVHLNVAFQEPTVPVSDDGRSRANTYDFPIDGRRGGRQWVEGSPAPSRPARVRLPPRSRGLVVAGEGDYDGGRVLDAARELGWPVLATAQSGLRGETVISSYHHILAGEAGRLVPEVVFVIGAVGPSQRLEALIGATGLAYRIDTWGRVLDPSRSASGGMLAGDPAATLEAQVVERAPEAWSLLWDEAEVRVGEALEDRIAAAPVTGPSVAAALNRASWDRLVVASSLPIRDVDAHLSASGAVIANRGASGIDGFVSTALGAASAGGATVALAGDLSALHDANGFLIDQPRNVVFVVVDNGGGGLFDLLPQATHAPSFERLFIAPQNRDFAHLAELHDLSFEDVDDDLAGEVDTRVAEGGIHLLRVSVDRTADLELRRSLDEAAVRALGDL